MLQAIFIGTLLLQVAWLCLIFVALYDVSAEVIGLDGFLALCCAFFLFELAGYGAFWLTYASPTALQLAKGAALLLIAERLWTMMRARRLFSRTSEIGEPLLYTSLFTIAVLAVAFANGGFDDPARVAAIRMSHGLPNDNQIPTLFADALMGGHVPKPFLGDWLTSDRPPLQTGLLMLLNFGPEKQSYQIIGSWLQATFLFGVWTIAVGAELLTYARRMVLLACCLLPTTIGNTLYTWPKMLSTTGILLVFALLFCYRPKQGDRVIYGVLLGGLAAFAVLSHGGGAFGLIGLAIVALIAWQWPPIKSTVAAVAALFALYIPWTLYQRFIDPPGNRLLKWHLAGVMPVDARSFGQTLLDSYGSLSLSDYVSGRIANFEMLFRAWLPHLRDLVNVIFTANPYLANHIRNFDFFFMAASLQFFGVAVIAALAALPFMGELRWQRRSALLLIGCAAATAIGYCILLFIPASASNHQGSYAVEVMLPAAAIIVPAARLPWLAVAFLLVQIAAVFVVYAYTLRYDAGFLSLQVLAASAAGGLLLYSFFPFVRELSAKRLYLEIQP